MRTPSAPRDPEALRASLQPGQVVADRYVVEGVLGQGGMGIVLAALDRVTQFEVALKVLLPGGAAIDGGKERFLREARAASALTGPHVALVIDTGALADGSPYMVMERLFGHDLRVEIYQRGRIPPSETAELLGQACEALAEAHGRGIVHRDLKPANLFLAQQIDGSRVLKVLDFGLAKVVLGIDISPEGFTRTGVVVGSPPYMSPEQLRSLKLADARSDIWSLGVIAYEMLTGQRPFQGEAAAGLIASIIADAPEPPRRVAPDVPEAFETLILRCLQKDPAGRPQTIADVARELSALSAPPSVRRAPSQPSITHIAPPPASAPHRAETGHLKTDDIQTSHILTGHIPTGHIGTDHIDAGLLKTDHIDTGLLKTDHFDTGLLKTDHFDTGLVEVDEVHTRHIETAHVDGGRGAMSDVRRRQIDASPSAATATMPLPGVLSPGSAPGTAPPAPAGVTTMLSMGSAEGGVPSVRAPSGPFGRPFVLVAALSVAALTIVTAVVVTAGGGAAAPGSGALPGDTTSREALSAAVSAPAKAPEPTTEQPTSRDPEPTSAPAGTAPPGAGTLAPSPVAQEAPGAAVSAASPASKPTGAPRPTGTGARPKRPGNTSDWR